MDEDTSTCARQAGSGGHSLRGEWRQGTLRLLPPPPGVCPVCAVNHPPEDCHNPESLYYQITFYERYGRYPTWFDAMAHCTEDVQLRLVALLAESGLDTEAEYEASVAAGEARRWAREREDNDER